MQYDRDELRHALATIPCRHCEAKGANATVAMDGPHFARLDCQSCGRFLDWLGWPVERPSERTRRRPRITKLGDEQCEICLRSRFQLPAPEQLHEHHVVEHAEGGVDHPDNTRVYCTSCHSLVSWVRTYFGHYHPEPVEDEAA